MAMRSSSWLHHCTDRGVDRGATAQVAQLREKIDLRLAELLAGAHGPEKRPADLIVDAIEYGVLAPGKRMRPLLMLLVGQGLGRPPEGALLDLSCAIEMVHAASLFLDDLPCMDNARLRRGRPSVHARFGEDVAILAAVALLGQAWAIAAGLQGVAPSVRNRLVLVLCNALGLKGLVRGQYRDLREGAALRSAHDIAEGNDQKTGALFAAALELAGLACGATEAGLHILRDAAGALGQAFQLHDDLEDGAPGAEQLESKDHHKDRGKSTLVALLGRELAASQLERHLHHAQTSLDSILVHDDMALWFLQRTFGPARAGGATRPR